MKTLVTGGAGFIGSNLVKQLLLDGHEVVVLDDLTSGYRCNLDPMRKTTLIEGDVRDKDVVEKAMVGCEVVFHLAASVGNKRSIDHPITGAEINVIGTLRILEAMRRAGTRKIVASSSAGIFGELKTLPIREDHPIDPDSPYGCTKLCEEKLCLAYAKLYALEAVCLRYFNVYGPNQRYDMYGNVIPIFVFQMLRDEPITIYGDGEQTRDFINVRDVVQANIKSAMVEGLSGAFNVGSGLRIAINRLAERVRDEVKRQGPDLSPKIVHGPPRAGDVRDSLAEIAAARKAFGFEPTTNLEQGLPQYVAWAIEETLRC